MSQVVYAGVPLPVFLQVAFDRYLFVAAGVCPSLLQSSRTEYCGAYRLPRTRRRMAVNCCSLEMHDFFPYLYCL